MDHPSQAGHWYKQDGTPCYTIVGQNGKERPTTLRDAKKLGLVPSVTEIMKLADKPGLTNWIIDQHIMACLTLPKIEGETEADYIKRIKEDARAQSEKAKEKGTQIHAWVQQGFEGISTEREESKFFVSANTTLLFECGVARQEWICEKPFATSRYGGKCDLHTNSFLIDIKTTEKDLETIRTWDEHAWQLSAYRQGLGLVDAKCGILYINVNTAESRLIWVEEKELVKGVRCFNALVDFWYTKKYEKTYFA